MVPVFPCVGAPEPVSGPVHIAAAPAQAQGQVQGLGQGQGQGLRKIQGQGQEALAAPTQPVTVEVMTWAQLQATSVNGNVGRGADGGVGGPGLGDAVVYVMSNQYVRVAFDGSGRLVQMYDRVWNRDLVPQGQLGNRFR